MDDSKPLVETSHILFNVLGGEKKVLDLGPVSLFPGKITFVMGPNGAGKSSFLSILSGHLAPDQGQVFWKGESLLALKDRLLPGFEHMALVRQEPSFDPFWTVEDQLLKATRHLTEKEKKKSLKKWNQICRLQPLLTIKTGNLSGGEKRRLALACSLIKGCELLLLDEPFADLDVEMKKLWFSILLEIREKENMSMVLVSHQGSDAHILADEVFTLLGGKWLEKMKKSDGQFFPKKLWTARLMGIKNLILKKDFPGLFRDSKSDWISIASNQISGDHEDGSQDLGFWYCLSHYKLDGNKISLWKSKGKDLILEVIENQDNNQLDIESGTERQLFFTYRPSKYLT